MEGGHVAVPFQTYSGYNSQNDGEISVVIEHDIDAEAEGNDEVIDDEEQFLSEEWERGREERTWESLREDAKGNLVGPDILERQRQERKRKYQLLGNIHVGHGDGEIEDWKQKTGNELPNGVGHSQVRRGVIRYLYLAVDLSRHSIGNDFRPSRIALISALCKKFIREFFEQNPLSHLGVLVMRNKVVEQLTPLSGSPELHVAALGDAIKKSCYGEVSLQNCLESALPGLVQCSPPYGCKELLILSTSLTTIDNGDIFKSIEECEKKNVRISIVGISAEVRICKRICDQTGGQYSVATSELNFDQTIMNHARPPAQRSNSSETDAGARLVFMGFPDNADNTSVAYFDDKKKIGVGGFVCPQCKSRVSELPMKCPTCTLLLISAPHLARSYHHLFPVPLFHDISMNDNKTEQQMQEENLTITSVDKKDNVYSSEVIICAGCGWKIEGVSLRCPRCQNRFCFDCDSYIHDRLFVCPGCKV